MERAAIGWEHTRETFQTVPADDRTLGEMAEQESRRSAESEMNGGALTADGTDNADLLLVFFRVIRGLV